MLKYPMQEYSIFYILLTSELLLDCDIFLARVDRMLGEGCELKWICMDV